jgi:predicted HAD superfamily phosphohydrolase YqeG
MATDKNNREISRFGDQLLISLFGNERKNSYLIQVNAVINEQQAHTFFALSTEIGALLSQQRQGENQFRATTRAIQLKHVVVFDLWRLEDESY